jgi:hypothetical protein
MTMPSSRFSSVSAARRRLRWAAALAIVPLLGLGGCAGLMGPRTLTFSDTELSEMLAKRFPMDRRVAELVDVTVSSPRVWLIPERNRLGTSFDVQAGDRLWGKALQGKLALDYALRFEPSDESIRLTQVRVQDFRLDAGSSPIPLPAQRIGGLLVEKMLEDLPIYHLKPEQAERMRRAGYQTSAVAVTSRGVEITLQPRP